MYFSPFEISRNTLPLPPPRDPEKILLRFRTSRVEEREEKKRARAKETTEPLLNFAPSTPVKGERKEEGSFYPNTILRGDKETITRTVLPLI